MCADLSGTRDRAGAVRGNLIGEIIGQGLDGENGPPLIYLAPLAANSGTVFRWAVLNLSAPNALYLSNRPSASVPAFSDDYFVQVVERWRLVNLEELDLDWAEHLKEGAELPLAAADGAPAPGTDDGESLFAPSSEHEEELERPATERPAPGPADARRLAAPRAPAPSPAEPAMDAVADLRDELLSGPSVGPPWRPCCC